MKPTILGDHPLATEKSGVLKSRIGTIFLSENVLVTWPGMAHYSQRTAFCAHINLQRKAKGLPNLSELDVQELWESAVDLIMTGKNILIRPEPDKMQLAFRADALLQKIESKRHIRFLRAREPKVQQAIRERGEYWRICPIPQKEEDIIAAIEKSKIALGGQPIYYYNEESGTRYLTCQTFTELADMSDDNLRLHLVEIQTHSALRNRLYKFEVAFFAANETFGTQAFTGHDFKNADPEQFRKWHAEIANCFSLAVPPELRLDNPGFPIWRNRMFARLFDDSNDTLAESVVTDLTPEFFRMVKWLPGGRIEHGELIFDSIFDDRVKYRDDQELAELCDERVKGFIGNFVREFGSIQYVNIGWVEPSLGHQRDNGHRVYLAEVMSRGAEKPVLRILRIQQWGIREHLDLGKDLLWAITEAMEYTEYTLDRRLACWELGMPLPGRIDTRMIAETYHGNQKKYHNARIWTTYYERDFIKGLATNRIPEAFLKDPAYALSVARLLGQAAAPNLVVGRTLKEGSIEVVFDGGDEMVLSDANGHPQRIVVADHAGTFHDYTSPLEVFAPGYAKPAAKRAAFVPDPCAFIDAYLAALSERLQQIQQECRQQRAAFTALFQTSKQGDKTFSDRWLRARDRLSNTDLTALVDRIREEIRRQIAS